MVFGEGHSQWLFIERYKQNFISQKSEYMSQELITDGGSSGRWRCRHALDGASSVIALRSTKPYLSAIVEGR